MSMRRMKEEVVLTSDEVGRQLGITGSAVRQIEKRALAKLRKRLPRDLQEADRFKFAAGVPSQQRGAR
jgi:DNA-directed RNA polymerase sigma subunit (sigma70/sigma32)